MLTIYYILGTLIGSEDLGVKRPTWFFSLLSTKSSGGDRSFVGRSKKTLW